ncbi:ribbon-helix-helix domain-containing protein [Neobacillus sp. M.A.Huq-85]
MDILGMLNDFIKDNKTDEQLANEFLKLLNKGNSLEHIAKLYEIAPQRIREIIKNSGKPNSKSNEKNINTLPSFNKDLDNKNDIQLAAKFISHLNKGLSIYDISKKFNFPVEKVKEILINTGYSNVITTNEEKTKLTAKTSEIPQKNTKTDLQLANEFVTLLYKGKSLEIIAELYEFPIEKIKEILSTNGYKNFMSSFEKRNQYTTVQLADELAALLNNKGNSIEKVAERHNLSTHQVKDILAIAGYTYYGFSKKWKNTHTPKQTKKSSSSSKNKSANKANKNTIEKVSLHHQLPLAVNELNDGKLMKFVAELFNITSANLRLDLKNNNYRYDALFKVWTKDSRRTLVEKLAKDLYDGKITFKDLEKQNVNVKILEIELRHSGHAYKKLEKSSNSNDTPLTTKTNKQLNNETVTDRLKTHHLITAEMLRQEEEEENILLAIDEEIKAEATVESKEKLNEDEISTLKEMINFWKQKKEEEEEANVSNVKVETTIFISSELLSILTKASEQEGISRSLIIEEALKAYLIY